MPAKSDSGNTYSGTFHIAGSTSPSPRRNLSGGYLADKHGQDSKCDSFSLMQYCIVYITCVTFECLAQKKVAPPPVRCSYFYGLRHGLKMTSGCIDEINTAGDERAAKWK